MTLYSTNLDNLRNVILGKLTNKRLPLEDVVKAVKETNFRELGDMSLIDYIKKQTVEKTIVILVTSSFNVKATLKRIKEECGYVWATKETIMLTNSVEVQFYSTASLTIRGCGGDELILQQEVLNDSNAVYAMVIPFIITKASIIIFNQK